MIAAAKLFTVNKLVFAASEGVQYNGSRTKERPLRVWKRATGNSGRRFKNYE